MFGKGNYEKVPNPNMDFYKDCTLVEGDCSHLAKVIKKAQAGGDIVIVGLGGSITQGYNKKTYGHLVAEWFRESFPNARVAYKNSGIGATGSIWGVERVKRDVIHYKPDLVFVEFSVNDADTPFEKEAYESMIRKLLISDTKPAVIHIANVRFDGNNVQEMHGEICNHYNIPAISMKNGVYGKIDWTEFIPDTIHPNDFGHEIIGSLLMMKLADIAASLYSIGEPDYKLPEPITQDSFKDCVYIPANEIPIEKPGSWKLDNELTCSTANGDSLVFKTNYSYLMLRYIGHPDGDAKIKIVVDGNEANTKTVDNYCGLFMHLIADAMYLEKPEGHTVEITMESGKEFKIVGIFAANFIS